MSFILDQNFLVLYQKAHFVKHLQTVTQHYWRNERETTELCPRITEMENKFYVEI
jgi:hypothetical protein